MDDEEIVFTDEAAEAWADLLLSLPLTDSDNTPPKPLPPRDAGARR